MRSGTIFLVILIPLIFVGYLLYWSAFPFSLPVATANGTYTNPCCGSFRLLDGVMTLDSNRHVRYVVRYDNIGRYVLPADYVGVLDGSKIVTNRSRNVFHLRLGGGTPPNTINLLNESSSYDFCRVELNGR